MNIYALQTARAGSKSVIDKNILSIDGKPLFMHNAEYAEKTCHIKDVFISTDSKFIIDHIHGLQKFNIIERPKHLCTDDASHQDAICHGVERIEEVIGEKLDIVVILLGNSLSAYTEDLDNACTQIVSEPLTDSILSVSKFNMFNPFRAHTINNGFLSTIVSQELILKNSKMKNVNDKSASGDVFFQNGSFMICRRDVVFQNGNLPFPWLGKNIKAYVQDTCMELDAEWQLQYFEKNYV